MFIKKKLTCAAAMAILFGAYSGCAWAWDINSTVTKTPEEANEHPEINITTTDTPGVSVEGTNDITIGGEKAETIKITSGTASAIQSPQRSGLPTGRGDIIVQATVDGGTITVYNTGDGDSQETNSSAINIQNPNTKIELKSDAGNTVTSARGSAVVVSGSASFAAENGANEINGAFQGLSATGSGSEVKLKAQSNKITSGTGNAVSAGEDVTVRITATEGNNTVTSIGGQDAVASNSGNVSLVAEKGNNVVTGYTYGVKSEGNNSEVSLTANGTNQIKQTELPVDTEWAAILASAVYSLNSGNLTLDAQSNVIEGTNAGIVNTITQSQSGNDYYEGSVEVTADDSNNITGGRYGVHIFSDLSSKENNGSVTITAKNGGNTIEGGTAVSAEDGGKVTVTAAQTNTLTATENNGTAVLAADEGNVTVTGSSNNLTGGAAGVSASGTNSSVNLIASDANSITGRTAVSVADSAKVSIKGSSNSVTGRNNHGISASSGGTVSLDGVKNSVSGNHGIDAEGSATNVTLTAKGNNEVDGTNSAVVASNGASINLTAQGDNTLKIETSGGRGISAESASNVSLDGANNYVQGGMFGVSSSGNETKVTLDAEGNNEITATSGSGSYGISTMSGGSAEVSGKNNIITASTYGVLTSYNNSTVTLNATGINKITATADNGAAVYANNGVIDVTGETVLDGATGVKAGYGGSVTFHDNVTTTQANAATATGEDSSIVFDAGLTTTTTSTLKASTRGRITVNGEEEGVVRYTGTTDNRDGGYIEMHLAPTSYWNLTGDSYISLLCTDYRGGDGRDDHGVIDMTYDNGFSTLTIGTLRGDGVIRMDVNPFAEGDLTNDLLLIDTFQGKVHTGDTELSPGRYHLEIIHPDDPDVEAAGTILAKIKNVEDDSHFTTRYHESGISFVHYTVETIDVNEYSNAEYAPENAADIAAADTEEGYTKYAVITDREATTDPNDPDDPLIEYPDRTTDEIAIMSAASLNYHSWMMQNTKLLQRLGDLRLSPHNGDNGAWFRISGSKLSYGGDNSFENKYIQYEAGYDKIVEQTSKYTMYGGIALTYSNGDSSYSNGDGDNESKAVSLYFTQINKGGSYLDVVFKLGRWKNDFAAYNDRLTRIEGETESTGMSISAEYGKKIALNNRGLYIEPQAQLTYGHLSGDDYTTAGESNSVRVHAEGIDSLVGRVGFNLGWDISPRANVYLKANVLHEFLGDYAVTMTDSYNTLRRSGDYSDTWFLYGLGAAFKLGKPNSGNFLYFDVERSDGGDLDQEWFYNVGFRFEM